MLRFGMELRRCFTVAFFGRHDAGLGVKRPKTYERRTMNAKTTNETLDYKTVGCKADKREARNLNSTGSKTLTVFV